MFDLPVLRHFPRFFARIQRILGKAAEPTLIAPAPPLLLAGRLLWRDAAAGIAETRDGRRLRVVLADPALGIGGSLLMRIPSAPADGSLPDVALPAAQVERKRFLPLIA